MFAKKRQVRNSEQYVGMFLENNYVLEKNNFEPAIVELNGSKFLLCNGYMGYRGTMEEYSADELVAVNLAGLFDKNGDRWREP